jgi:probable HAF family extracellular repeat protein
MTSLRSSSDIKHSRAAMFRYLGGFLIILFLGARADAGLAYVMTDLGQVEVGADINDAGGVVAAAPFGSTTHAFLYTGGARYDLGTLGGDVSEAYGINDSGQIAGASRNSSGSIAAFLYSNGSMHDLGTLGGNGSAAYGLNATGQVVGQAELGGNLTYHAFLYTNGVMADLGALGEKTSVAVGINNAGQVVGSYVLPSGLGNHAFLYTGGVMQDIGDPNGYSSAYSINAGGQVVGESQLIGGPDHAFLYSSGVMQDLGVLSGGNRSTAYGINDAGQIVGFSETTSYGSTAAFVDTAGTMYDLNNLVVNKPSSLVITKALAINNNGQIVAYGSDGGNLLLLTPIAVPLPQAAWAVIAMLPLFLLVKPLRCICPSRANENKR